MTMAAPAGYRAQALPPADPDRLDALISGFAELTEPDAGRGVTRLAYTPLERRAHDLFAERMRGWGLSVRTDAAGNTIAERRGTQPGLPAIGTGSHLDSVPIAGSFDGIAGVAAAMEVARLYAESPVDHRHPMRFVVFAAEEGARFGQACTGSRIIAGLTTSADLDNFVDGEGTSIAEAMRGVGLDPAQAGQARWEPAEWAAFLELHIEQGAVLASRGVPLGVVDLISGSTRLLLDVTGRASHSGGTPMRLRADALAAAAEIVLCAENLANDARHHGTRITVGRLDTTPGSITTIAGHCAVHVDIRDIDNDRQRETATEFLARARDLCARRGVRFDARLLADTSPVVLPSAVRDTIIGACTRLGLPYRVMPSGASHDAQMINHIVPAGMLFVPSQNHGVSHAPEEYTTSADLVTGVNTLAASLLALDRALSPTASEPGADNE